MNSVLIANRYKIADLETSRIGRGGMGDVYRATDAKTGQVVAIKHLNADVIARDPSMVERFGREAEALRRLNHPNIVTVLNNLADGNNHYIVMEYMPGGSLEELLARQHSLPIEQVLKIGLELADALTRAHHLNIVHRDIKPANVLLAADGTPRLTDFGVAHLEDMARITQTGMLTGTYAYLSPEACDGLSLDARADIWSFGVLLYEMTAGKRPFQGDSLAATLTAILTRPTPDLREHRPETPEALANLIYQMLQKNPQERSNSARLVGAQLEAIISGAGVITPSAGGSRFDTETPEPVVIGPRHNLPSQPTPFVGREQEIAEVARLLDDPDCRLLTLVGPGGMGKTRLSIEAALRKVDDFTHGVRFVPLAPVSTPDLLATAVASALNISFFTDDDPRSLLLQYLREKELLLVMDNFEHLLDGADLVVDMLADAPRLKIMTTSREALNLWEEWTRPVLGMNYPEETQLATLQPRDLETYNAIQLFNIRARRVRGGFNPMPELPHIVRICRLVDGMPLGIELAAAWLKMLSPEQIVQEIERNFGFLTTNIRNIAERHRSIRAVFDYSWQLLTPSEQAAFRRLAVFRGGFRRQAAEKVAGASLPILSALVSKSLLYEGESHTTTTPSAGQMAYRYTMHELLKQYAAEKLAEDEQETAVAHAQHAAYYTQLLAEQEPILKGSRQKIAYDLLNEEIENIRAAWDWCVTHLVDDPEAAAYLGRAAESLCVFYDNRGLAPEGLEKFTQALTALEAIPHDTPTARLRIAQLMVRRGLFLYRTNQNQLLYDIFREAITRLEELLAETEATAVSTLSPAVIQYDIAFAATYLCHQLVGREGKQQALALIERAEALCHEINDPWALARTVNVHAIILNQAFHRNEEGIAMYHQSLAIARQTGDRILIGRALHNLAGATPDPNEAQRYMEENQVIQQELESNYGLMMSYNSLIIVAMRRGDYTAVQEYGRQAVSLMIDMGAIEFTSSLYIMLARAAWAIGDITEAHRYFEQVAEQSRHDGNVLKIMSDLFYYGLFLLETESEEAAYQNYKKGTALLSEITTSVQKAAALNRLGNFAVELGLYDAAQEYFTEAAAIFTDQNDQVELAWAWRHLGEIAYDLGDYHTAKTWLEKSLTLHRQVSPVQAEMELLDSLGRLAFGQCDYQTAADHYCAALTLTQTQWGEWHGLITLVNQAQLIHKWEMNELALEILYFIREHPLFAPGQMKRRARQKHARLLEEVESQLPQEVRLAAEARAVNQTYQTLVTTVLAAANGAMVGEATCYT